MKVQLAALFAAADIVVLDGLPFGECTAVTFDTDEGPICAAVHRAIAGASVIFMDQVVYLVGNGEVGHEVWDRLGNKYKLRFLTTRPLQDRDLK